jgi:16S rRNA (guanine966-N2)-methyltransferase
MTMRIIAGRYKGRRLQMPPGDVRPAMDRMRVSLFDILGNLDDTSFLDLFSGTGAVGIEAASRGASPVYLVERNAAARETLLRNTSFVETEIVMRFFPAELFLKRCDRLFSTVYLDPPFRYPDKPALLALAEPVVEPDGQLIIHAPREDRLPDTVGRLALVDRRAYGRSILSFYAEPEVPAAPQPPAGP